MMTISRIAARGLVLLLPVVPMFQGCAGSGDRAGQAHAGAPSHGSDAAGPSASEPGRGAIPVAETSVVYSDLDGIHAQVARRRGRPLLLNFWATWCVPCVEELPDLALLAEEYGEKGPAFLGISFDAWVTGGGDETERKVRETLAEAGVRYANLIYDGDQDPILSAFDLPGPIPYSILLDGEGETVFIWESTIDIDRLRSAVADLPARSGAGSR